MICDYITNIIKNFCNNICDKLEADKKFLTNLNSKKYEEDYENIEDYQDIEIV
jgi:predicted house-cleaning noncanonical NTP pyrophosphatase (MazG superfamily)